MWEDIAQISASIDDVLEAVVSVRAQIPEDALSADVLGSERSGHGVVIREDGLVLTIGYLIADAEQVWIGIDDETLVPACVIASDYETGFGLLQPTLPVDLPWVELGSSGYLEIDEPVFVVGSGGIGDTIEASVVAKQEFAGRWEYLLDEAVYTAPAHHSWAGAALLNGNGQLCGIGSLLVQTPGTDTPANMFVPVDILKPVFENLCRYGRPGNVARPWLGALIQDEDNQLQVVAVYQGCPAEQGGILPGDTIIAIDGVMVADLADFYRKLWARGGAGIAVTFTLVRAGRRMEMSVVTADRNAFIKKDTIN